MHVHVQFRVSRVTESRQNTILAKDPIDAIQCPADAAEESYFKRAAYVIPRHVCTYGRDLLDMSHTQVHRHTHANARTRTHSHTHTHKHKHTHARAHAKADRERKREKKEAL